MPEHAERGWDDAPGAAEARRKLVNLLAGDYLLYEITADREMLVLRLPTRVRPPAGSAGRAFPTAGEAAPPAA
jgi:hypothetical protein